MTDPVPSTTHPDGTTPIDPTAVAVGDQYTLTDSVDDEVTIEITSCQHGTDDDGNPQPTILNYVTVPETSPPDEG